MIKWLFEIIDTFGEPVELRINNKTKTSTSFGWFLTLLTIISLLAFAWFIGNDIINKEVPFSFEQKLITNNYPRLEINSTNFPFAISVTDFNNVPLNDDTFLKLNLH